MGDKKIERTNNIPGASGLSREMQDLLAQLAQAGAGQMGDLSDLAAGRISATAEDRRLAEESAGAARGVAEIQARQNMEEAMRAVEAQLLERGLAGSSIEAVNQATAGRQYQQTLDQIALQNQGQMAESLMNLPFQRAGTQLTANQLLLQRLVGGASPIMQTNLQERLAQGTTTQTEEGGLLGQVLGAAAQGTASAI